MRKNAVLFSAGEYQNSKTFPKPTCDLSGVKFDVLAIEKRLKQIGFDVIKKENANKSEYIPALQQCVDKSPSDAIHIVYFSGHGGHCNGKNLIYPSDFTARYDDTKDIEAASVNIEDIISVFKGKGRLILILDACRKDFGASKGYFSEMTSAENVYIAYGTMFENEATGVNDGLSWFTEAICDEILAPNIDVDTLFTRIRQNIFTKHYVQIPPSVNSLLESVILHTKLDFCDIDKQVYDFIEKYGDEYTEKYGYFSGEYIAFIDASQFFDIGLLDAYWHYTKVQNKLAVEKGIKMPLLSEAEQKIVSFMCFNKGKKYFYHDESYTWYFNGRQIRMGEIPPLPPSMQPKLPEKDKELIVCFKVKKDNGNVVIETNLPDNCELFINHDKVKCSQKYMITNGEIVIENADAITKITIDSGVFTSDMEKQRILGEKCRNLAGVFIKYHPIHGNHIDFRAEI